MDSIFDKKFYMALDKYEKITSYVH